MGDQTVHVDSNNVTRFKYKYKKFVIPLSQNEYTYGLKIAGTDQVSFGPVPVLMVVKIIWSTGVSNKIWIVIQRRSALFPTAQNLLFPTTILFAVL